MERLCGLFTVHSEKVLFLSMVSCYNKKTIRSVIVTGQGAAGRAALPKAQQDIKRIQAAGVMDISEVERICRALQDVVQELRILIDQ